MNQSDVEGDTKIECYICKKIFKKTYIKQHITRCHPAEAQKINKSPSIKCCLCGKIFFLRQVFRNHVNESHLKIERSNLVFKNFDDFEAWLKKEEDCRKIHFNRRRTPSRLSNGIEKIDYFCQYDNSKRFGIIPCDRRRRALKSQGSYKIDGCCSAQIIVEIKSDNPEVKVEYFSTHIGHTWSLAHYHSRDEIRKRKELADKIEAGVSLDRILDDVLDNINDAAREDVISQQTLHSIASRCALNSSWKRDVDDTTSVTMWIETVINTSDDYNPICFFKMQGNDYPGLNDEDFVLMIMTKIQYEILNQFGNRILCVHSIQGTNQYEFFLTTLLIVDDNEEEFPAAYLISNRNDTLMMTIFFDQLRLKIGRPLSPQIFMSDDFPDYFNTFLKVMKPDIPPKQLLCTCHVDENWREALSMIRGRRLKLQEKQVTVYTMLRTLLKETKETTFLNSLGIFVTDLMSHKSTKKFGIYFKKNYTIRVETWAYCFRLGAGIKTYMKLENFHRLIKSVYNQGGKMMRLDACIQTLLGVVRHKHYERIMKLAIIPYSSQKLNLAHRKSISIDNEDVEVKNENLSFVKLQGDPDIRYSITKVNESCPYKCNIICIQCDACIHLYECTCIEYSIKGNMCEHIHKICIEKVNSSNTISYASAAATSNDDALNDLVRLLQSEDEEESSENEELKKEFFDKSRCLYEKIEKNSYHPSKLKFINNLLTEAISALSKPHYSEEEEQNELKKSSPNEKNVLQLRVLPIKRKRVNTEKNTLKKPTFQEKQQIREEVVEISYWPFDHLY